MGYGGSINGNPVVYNRKAYLMLCIGTKQGIECLDF